MDSSTKPVKSNKEGKTWPEPASIFSLSRVGGEAAHVMGDDCNPLHLCLWIQSTGKGCSGNSFCPGAPSSSMWWHEVRPGLKVWAGSVASALSLLVLSVLPVTTHLWEKKSYGLVFSIITEQRLSSRVGGQLSLFQGLETELPCLYSQGAMQNPPWSKKWMC